ncbi:MAG: UDP-N-acetylmuramate--L-alanine ligase [Clostridia bacterium]|nr:UDP-N-acetylmuramate--L-alanine ligase [Clostridia bacterium]
MKVIDINKLKSVHFVGVGGISMSALALFCIDRKIAVSGSDINANSLTENLENLGAKIYYTHSEKNVSDCDLLVYSSAVLDANPELKKAREKGIPTMKRIEFLSLIESLYLKSVGVAGCHGKTTTTAMIANSLILAGVNPTVFLGGEDKVFGNFRVGKDVAVIEACEYKKNLLHLHPTIALVLNLDNDHMDSYADMEDLTDTFKRFCKGRISVINADDINSQGLFDDSTVTFGIKNRATYTAKDIKFNGEGYSFTACAYSQPVCKINLRVSGLHNVYNALACFAVCHVLGVESKHVKGALENFSSVKRRDEFLGEFKGVKVFGDYAHHPKEIDSILSVFSKRFEDFAVVFQPHTYSRTKLLIKDFVSVLKDTENLYIYKTYPAREKFDEQGDAKTLAKNIIDSGGKCEYIRDQERLLSVIEKVGKKVDAVLVLGAGDIYQIVEDVIKKDKIEGR